MGGIVIADQVQLPVGGDSLVDEAEKLEPLLVPMAPLLHAPTPRRWPRFSAANRVAVPLGWSNVRVIGGAAPALQRQAGLGTIQSLNLALLVGAQHQRVFRRVEIHADDVFQFLGECRIVADLESFHAMRFQSVDTPDAPHAGFADADGRSHGAHSPSAWALAGC